MKNKKNNNIMIMHFYLVPFCCKISNILGPNPSAVLFRQKITLVLFKRTTRQVLVLRIQFLSKLIVFMCFLLDNFLLLLLGGDNKPNMFRFESNIFHILSLGTNLV